MTNPSNLLIQRLIGIVGEKNVILEKSEKEHLSKDWTNIYTPSALAVVLPKDVNEVSLVMKICHEHMYPVVPSGGRTGLAAGAVASKREIVLSLSRLNKIINVDPFGLTIETEAGVTTQALQEAAEQAGFFFPLDLAAKGSSQIGGNIATNAGGLKFIRYGGAREQVLGLEVVLANGEILDINSKLRKNNTGYDLKQIFIGSEGTLGIITKATLKMVAKPVNFQLACLGLESFSGILQLLRECHLSGICLTAFEFFTKEAHEIVLKHFPKIKSPFQDKTEYYVLLEIESEVASSDALESLLEKAFEQNIILDGVMAQSKAEFDELWSLRENITESIQADGHVYKNDIALPIDKLGVFIDEMLDVVNAADENIKIILFGHIGDGNLHLNYIASPTMDINEFRRAVKITQTRVFELLQKYRGSISAEHGVGLIKKEDLHYSRTLKEILIMKDIKNIFDPFGILNPGKIFS
ncbi:MAG: FAD-binding oxidoreductase [Bdellovibrionota bacterium]